MLIPALIAVLLGETGGRLAARGGRPGTLILLAVMLVVGAVAGFGLAAQLTPWARTLLVGMALIAAALPQLRAALPRREPAWQAVWLSGAPLTVLALAAFAGAPLAAAAGGIAGAAAAILLGSRIAWPKRAVRRLCGALLLAAGLGAALTGLRLV